MPYIHGKSIIRIAIAEDHQMFRELVSAHIDTFENCKVVIQAADGAELIEKIESKDNTDLVLLDVSMHPMNGYDTATILHQKFPDIKILFCSIYDHEMAICRMVACGGNGFVHKGASTSDLKKAIYDVMRNKHYFSQLNGKIFSQTNGRKARLHCSDKELKFLQLIRTEKTYKQIASDLGLTLRQVDYLRESLFARFNVHSRTGLAFSARYSGILTEERV
jgi:two-component system, NarL family, invasion response regulator UvrY